MKYSGRFSNKIDMSVFDEITIQYNSQDRQLIDFMSEHPNQRIILVVADIQDYHEAQEWKKLNAIAEKYPDFNFQVCFHEARRFEEFNEILEHCIKETNISCFTGYVVTSFDQLHYLLSKDVSQVYLAEDICFDLRRAKRLCAQHQAEIRAFPNVGQCSVKAGPALKKFFIRPEDVEEYSDVIDTLEFWGPLDRQSILHKIYSKGVWFGDLKDLILDFDISFDSRRIVPGFAQIRKTCSRKCMKGDSCFACERVYNISKKLEDKELIIKQKKNN